MKHLIFILSIIAPLIANCESYFIDGMKWDMLYTGSHIPVHVYTDVSVYLEGDTIIDGISAYKMYEEMNHVESSRELVTAVYEKDNKVWFRYFPDGKWYLMYDFNLKPGEGCIIYNVSHGMSKDRPPYSSYIKCVQTEDADSYYGHPTLHLEEYNLLISDYTDLEYLIAKGTWLKGIGSISGVLENNRYDAVGVYSELVEASINGEILYRIGENSLCDLDLAPIKIAFDASGLNISNIDKADTLTIHTAQGALIGSYDLTSDDISIPLPYKGIYLISVGSYSAKIRY